MCEGNDDGGISLEIHVKGKSAVTLLKKTDLYDRPEECQDLAPKL